MSHLDQAVASLITTYQQAVLARDVDMFVQMYDPDVQVFDTWGTWCYQGRDAWRQMVQGWFSSLGDQERVEVRVADLRITSGGTLAVVTAAVAYAAIDVQGRELRTMNNRLTWALQAQGVQWRIVHEHTSVPVSFEDAKGMLQREPAR
jgi:uncharacterized protein (TIGR02246 family)